MNLDLHRSELRSIGPNPIILIVSWVFCKLTGQFADKHTRGQSSRGLDNSRTSQLADSEFF